MFMKLCQSSLGEVYVRWGRILEDLAAYLVQGECTQNAQQNVNRLV